MSRVSRALLVGVLWGLGCGPTLVVDDAGDSTSGQPPATTGPGTATAPPPPPPSMTTTPVDPSTTTTMPPPDSGEAEVDEGFIMDPDVIPSAPPCDFYEQDCEPGFKCVPYADGDTSSWTTMGCFPVHDDPGSAGSACTGIDGAFSGFDDCDATSLCWGEDPKTDMGTCVEFCLGPVDNPTCPDMQTCSAGNDFGLCFPRCNPLIQGCPDGQACYPLSRDFACIPTSRPHAPGEACTSIDGCAVDSFCANTDIAPGCMGTCCTPFCDLGDPMPPCLAGQVCTPWYEGMAPPGFETLGACLVP